MKSVRTCDSLGRCTAGTAGCVPRSEGRSECGSPRRPRSSALGQGEDFAVLPQGRTVSGAEVQNLPPQKGQKFQFCQKRDKACALTRQLSPTSFEGCFQIERMKQTFPLPQKQTQPTKTPLGVLSQYSCSHSSLQRAGREEGNAVC